MVLTNQLSPFSINKAIYYLSSGKEKILTQNFLKCRESVLINKMSTNIIFESTEYVCVFNCKTVLFKTSRYSHLLILHRYLKTACHFKI